MSVNFLTPRTRYIRLRMYHPGKMQYFVGFWDIENTVYGNVIQPGNCLKSRTVNSSILIPTTRQWYGHSPQADACEALVWECILLSFDRVINFEMRTRERRSTSEWLIHSLISSPNNCEQVISPYAGCVRYPLTQQVAGPNIIIHFVSSGWINITRSSWLRVD